MKTIQKKWIAAALALTIAGIGAQNISIRTAAEDTQIAETNAQPENVQKVVTEYEDLWKGTIAFKAGETVQWYVHVPEGTEPKGCGATIKIPGLGWGTEERNKEENHLTLTQGDNLVYTFTPEAGDYIFTCWMGSGCHANYINVTEDGTYNAEKPADPTDIHAERSGSTVTVSFTAPDAPENAKITGYKVIATDPDDKRTKTLAQESPVTLENLDAQKSYTIQIITLATSGQSAGEQTFTLDAEPTPKAATEPTEAPTETTVANSDTTPAYTAPDHPADTSPHTEPPVSNAPQEQIIITEYEELWKGNITVRQGVPVKWYVHVPEDTTPKGCGATIKIPGLGWGTDTNDKNENHLTLQAGQNFVYAFTPQKTEDVLFTCWMGSGCHHNYIHVIGDVNTASGQSETNAAGSTTNNNSSTSSNQTTTEATTTTKAASEHKSEIIILGAAASVPETESKAPVESAKTVTTVLKASADTPNPKTGESDHTGFKLVLIGSLGVAAMLYKWCGRDHS